MLKQEQSKQIYYGVGMTIEAEFLTEFLAGGVPIPPARASVKQHHIPNHDMLNIVQGPQRIPLLNSILRSPG